MRRVRLLVERFGQRTETFIAAETAGLRAAGVDVVVEALASPTDPAPDVAVAEHVWEHETTAQRLGALAWLVARHPLGCVRDLAARRRWRRQEQVQPLRWLAPAARRVARDGDGIVLHAHFAWSAALEALRLHRLLGVPYSVTAHANDIYVTPANLHEKLEHAALATTGCAYTARTLREVAPAARVEVVVMGIDPDALRPRDAPADGGRSVVAVGRLVEKKGFADLLRAAALLAGRGRPLDRLTIAGDGPLRDELEALAAGIPGAKLVGAIDHDDVPALVAEHDLLAMPCVVAADGDRDSMPVVVKEALALAVPVVATDEVGLPEVVRDGWGRLVPPHDPAALADALDELLALPPARRHAMGLAGRTFVAEHCDARREAARLAALLRVVVA
ncbi:glycosyltransferase [Conexibacter sp. SYSU D00693]|uniref:glycosyltransferase n=1 Tax=Conexibacter sp. SYSU D00693 TaxID=2812560 RepID=UPI00196B8D02|nr:glycosyltransferase [Conexibacter sp. SYSU D00693]